MVEKEEFHTLCKIVYNYQKLLKNKNIYKSLNITKLMKNLFRIFVLALAGISLAGCQYDDSDVWNEMEQIKNRIETLEEAVIRTNEDIVALQTIVNALQKNVYVTSVTPAVDGYTIVFSDGTTAEIKNGKDGVNGTNAPIVSVKLNTDDGNYYWTLDGEWLLVDGEKVRASGIDGENGENGKDAIAPQVRINENTKEWEISTDGGKVWVSTGIVAEGKDGINGSNGSNGAAGDSLFKKIDTNNPDYVIITLAIDDTELRLARYDESAPMFVIAEAPNVAQIEYSKSVEFTVEVKNIADYVVNTPQGWKASYTEGKLIVTAPAKDLCHFDKKGVVAITVVSEQGKSAIVKLNVMAGEWVEEEEIRTLTFEDGTQKFDPYDCLFSYAMMGNEEYKWIEKWSDYIPRDGQYGNGHGAYEWHDAGNTELAFMKPTISSWWGISGHAGISDYVGTDKDIEQFANDNMMFMIDLQAYNVKGGANGSKNFCSQYGYLDPDEYATQYSPEGVLPGLQFYDGVPRVIDHMYVTNTTYAYGIITRGECDFGGSYEYTNESTFKVVAYGYDSLEDTEPTSTEFYLLNTNKRIVTDWTKWDLSVLGKVVRVEFNLVACYEGYGRYGLVIPAYFAYDDVAVQFGSKQVFK